jgi:hypothetical protein
MLTMRPINIDGAWGDKQKKVYIFDDSGNKIYDPKKRQYKCNTVKTTDWNDKTKADEWRSAWESFANAALEKHGFAERIDHRSYAEQGVEKIPTIHLGVAATRMERRGFRTSRGDLNRRIEVTNNELRQLRARIVKVKDWLYSSPIGTTPTFVEMMQAAAGGEMLRRGAENIMSKDVPERTPTRTKDISL